MLPRHLPVRRFNRDAPNSELMLSHEIRPFPSGRIWYFLYRFYDADRQPLYFGVAADNASRWVAHRKNSPWWPEAEYVALSYYDGWDSVRDAERAAMRHEEPRFNKQGKRWHAQEAIPLRGGPEKAAYILLRQARPEFVRELARLLATEPIPEPAPAIDWTHVTKDSP